MIIAYKRGLVIANIVEPGDAERGAKRDFTKHYLSRKWSRVRNGRITIWSKLTQVWSLACSEPGQAVRWMWAECCNEIATKCELTGTAKNKSRTKLRTPPVWAWERTAWTPWITPNFCWKWPCHWGSAIETRTSVQMGSLHGDERGITCQQCPKLTGTGTFWTLR